MINSSADAGIPLLTEILVAPSAEPTLNHAPDAAAAAKLAAEVKNDSMTAARSAATTPAAAVALTSPSVPFSDFNFAADVTSAAPPAASVTSATSAARTEPAMKFGAADLGVDFDIPERFLPASAGPASTTSAIPPSASALFAAPTFAAPSVASHTVSSAEWEQLEADITERISRQVLSRIDFVLEQRVRDSLADVLQIAVEGLAQEIKRGLHQTLEDVIGRAVAQEIARLQTSKN